MSRLKLVSRASRKVARGDICGRWADYELDASERILRLYFII